MRIVSLVPSLTELFFDMDLADQLVGRTRFCIHPEHQVNEIPIIGGTKNPNIEKILDLSPDIVIANKEENRKEDIEALSDELKVHVTEINSVEDAFLAMHELGELLNRSDEAHQIISDAQLELNAKSDFRPLNAAYLIWRNPWMVAANHTYINDVLKKWDLNNVFQPKTRYPETNLDELRHRYPDVILLSSEPYPFKDQHIQEIRDKIPGALITLVDGEWFSWYGSRMVPSFKSLNSWRKSL